MIDKSLLRFWSKKINNVIWKKKPKNIVQITKGKFEWFSDGTINVAENIIKKNIDRGLGKKTALIYLKENGEEFIISYNELNLLVKNFSDLLKIKNYKKKPIFIHGSASIETSVSMLSSAFLGYKHCVIFDELEGLAIEKRLKIIKPGIVITKSKDKKKLNFFKKLKKKLNYSLIVLSDTKNFVEEYSKLVKNNFLYRGFKSNNQLFTLFTSGSTGEPKGIIHSSGGYLIYAKQTIEKQFGLTKNSVILCASDAGWINGHTYSLYGPLSCGATSILLQKPTMILNVTKLRYIIKKFKVNILYLPVTLIRMLKSLNFKASLGSKNLKTLGSMGEPLAKNVARWFANKFNCDKKSVINTYFQTETGGIICSPNFKDKSNTHGTVGKPMCKEIVLNLKKNKTENNLKIVKPWPGCMINVENGKKVWKSYFDKNLKFKLFDIGKLDKLGNILILGRNDDVINIRGHRVGTGEIESAVLKINEIVETCAIPVPDKIEGNKIVLFIVARNFSKKKLRLRIENNLIELFGSFAIPKETYFVNSIPKTRSGKILRRIMKSILLDDKKNLGDTSTILDKGSLKHISMAVKKNSELSL